jgi:hypothetical protein
MTLTTLKGFASSSHEEFRPGYQDFIKIRGCHPT